MNKIFAKLLFLSLILLPATILADTNEYIIGADAPVKAVYSQPVTTSMEVLWDGKFEAGHKVSTTVRLKNIATGNILTINELRYLNGQNISFFVIDPTLTDFQKVTLDRSETPYVYNFSFIPKFSNSYKLWAIFTPNATGKEEALNGWIGKEDLSFVDRKLSYKTVMGGYIFTLSSDRAPMVGSSCIININVTDQDGKPVESQAQAISPLAMEYSRDVNHIIGFYDDFQHIIHAYEFSEALENNNAIQNIPGQEFMLPGQGFRPPDSLGPDFQFKIEPRNQGFVKLFASIKINGKNMVIPFSFYINQ